MAFTRPKAAQIDFDVTNISDPLIRLNSGQSGSADKDVGIVVERGSDTNVALIWDESTDSFAVINTSEDGSTSGDVTISSYADLTLKKITQSEQQYTTSNMMKFNQIYTGASAGSYFTQNEYQKILTIIPSADAENYQISGRILAQSAGSIQTIEFTAALRSETLPDLSWSVTYTDTHNGTAFFKPQLWTKETTTAGFIIAIQKISGGNLYGTVTVDIDVIPRTSSQKSNVTMNTTQNSETTSVDTGYTANDMTKIMEINGDNIDISAHDGSSNGLELAGTLVTATAAELNYSDGVTSNIQTQLDARLALAGGTMTGNIVMPSNGTIGLSGSGTFINFDETSTTYTGTDMSIGSNQSVHVLVDMNADGASVGGFTVRTGASTIDTSTELFKVNGSGAILADGAYDFDIASHDGTNGLKLGGTLVTSTAAELNILDGVTATTAELNYSDGVTSNIQTQLDARLALAGGTMSGAIAMGTNKITGMGDPTANQDAATKAYVDTQTSSIVTTTDIAGDTGTDTVTLGSDTLTFSGTANEITTAVTDNTVTISLPDDVTIGSDLTVTGNLTVNGTTTTISTTNSVVSDSLIELNTGAASNANDLGIVMERGSTGNNAIIAWDESADAFVMGTTTATGASTGDLTIANGELRLDTLRIDQSGTGLRMTNVGAFDNDGSDNFRIFATNDLQLKANGDSGGGLSIDATNNDVTIDNDLRVSAGQFYYGGTAVTSTATELNLLDGVTATTAELNYTDGVTSNIQTQLDGKVDTTGNNTITSTTAGSSAAPEFELFRDITGADANYIGQIKFSADNDADSKTVFAKITGKIGDASSGSEDGIIEISHQKAGSQNINVRMTSTEFKIMNGTDFDVETHDGSSTGLRLANTLVTATAAELNILDGVTSTASELNILDGDTSATSTTLADADRVVVNDAGTMKQVALTDFETYFESALDTLSNVTSVGTLNGITIASTQTIDMGANRVTNVADPVGNQDAATKAYVDANAGSGGGASGFTNSTFTTAPGADGDFDLSYNVDQDTQETPFEAGGTDAFGVALGEVYDMMEPVGSTSVNDMGAFT